MINTRPILQSMIPTRIERQTVAGFISAFSGPGSLQIALHSTMIITVSINVFFFFFFFFRLQRERDGGAGATKRETFYVLRSGMERERERKREGMLWRMEDKCCRFTFKNPRPSPLSEQSAETENRQRPLRKCHSQFLDTFLYT